MTTKISGASGVDRVQEFVLDAHTTAKLDEWLASKSVFGLENILGTVSGTGSFPNVIPTGAIMECGSNPNGQYIKFANGFMLCHTPTFTPPAYWGAGTRWSFPSMFSLLPSVMVTTRQLMSQGAGGGLHS